MVEMLKYPNTWCKFSWTLWLVWDT